MRRLREAAADQMPAADPYDACTRSDGMRSFGIQLLQGADHSSLIFASEITHAREQGGTREL